MDLSSKYFTSLNLKNPNLVKAALAFIFSVYRVGKVTELFSFAYWEIRHQLRLYHTNKYIKFTTDVCLLLSPEETFQNNSPIVSEYLQRYKMSFEPVEFDWKYCFVTSNNELWGSRYSRPNALFYNSDKNSPFELAYEFQHPITSLFISTSGFIFVCSNATVFKSSDNGRTFTSVVQLSSSISYFLFNNGMTETPDGTLIIGEYGSVWTGNTWQNLAFIYYSHDHGETWAKTNFLVREGTNKHVHLVKYSKFLRSVLLTDGDNKKRIWINRTYSNFTERASRLQSGWCLVNKFHHQTGGYTSMTETDSTVLFGSDYLGGTNFIIKTQDGKRFKKLVVPDPYRRSPIMNMITRQSISGNEIWAFSYSCLSKNTKSLLMCSKDDGQTWAKVIDFDGTRQEVRLVNSSSSPSNKLFIAITTYTVDGTPQYYSVYQIADEVTKSIK